VGGGASGVGAGGGDVHAVSATRNTVIVIAARRPEIERRHIRIDIIVWLRTTARSTIYAASDRVASALLASFRDGSRVVGA
jgi:hypothetical protein